MQNKGPVPTVALIWIGDLVTISGISESGQSFGPNQLDSEHGGHDYYYWEDPFTGARANAVYIPYAMPGTSDVPEHMAKAINHLIDVCKANPDSAPKDLF